MFNLISNLRNKSDSQKRTIVFFGTIFVMILIIAVWVFLNTFFSKNQEKTNSQNTNFISSFVEQISTSIKDFKNIFSDGIEKVEDN
jgi:uncharacterized membrane protein YvbJ